MNFEVIEKGRGQAYAINGFLYKKSGKESSGDIYLTCSAENCGGSGKIHGNSFLQIVSISFNCMIYVCVSYYTACRR